MSSKATSKEILTNFYIGRRLSYDGSLCTVRWIGQLLGTKGEWIGVEWDDSKRGKHDGTHQEGRIFHCICKRGNPASFIRPTRSPDPEQTVTEAIKSKYGGMSSDNVSESEAIVISGKVAEEIGFAKIAQEQSQLSELEIVLIDQLVVNGLAPRESAQETIQEVQRELSRNCPNIEELDLGYNVIENWQDIADICIALPKLNHLTLGGLRFSSFTYALDPIPFPRVASLAVDECLVSDSNITDLLKGFNRLELLNLNGNELDSLSAFARSTGNVQFAGCDSLKTIFLDNNQFQDLDCVAHISKAFPHVSSISLGSNYISDLGQQILSSKQIFPQIKWLSLQDNQITSIDFLDALSNTFPALTFLRVSGNPFYTVQAGDTDPKASDKLFYLSLARIPSLTQLNYGKISNKDREEGEIYYISIVGQKIHDLLSSTAGKATTKEQLESEVNALYPRYQHLCEKYARESAIEQFWSSLTTSTSSSTKQPLSQGTIYPPGSLGARLVTAIFYIPASHASSSPTVTKQLPLSMPVTSLMAYLCHVSTFSTYLAPLQFNMIFESAEFDPVDTTTDSSTRSRVYAGGHRLTKEEKEDLWKEWGDWDADALLEDGSLREANGEEAATAGGSEHNASEEHWTEDGFLMRDGRKWKRREVNIPHSVRRPWGDWIDIESGGPERKVKVRIEPFVRPKRRA